MITVTLYGTPACRRYQWMRELALNASKKISIPIELKEIGDTESLSRINPLSLPRMYIDVDMVASQNPPKPQVVEAALEKAYTH